MYDGHIGNTNAKSPKKNKWLEEKRKGISGTEASAILGLNPYMTNVELWKYKTGRKERQEKENEFMKYGRDAEGPLIEMFRLDYPNYKVNVPEPYSLQRNKKYMWMLGTVDAELNSLFSADLSGDNSSPDGFLEIKTATIYSNKQKEKWNDGVPDYYYIQILHYFLVNEAYKYCYLKVQLNLKFKDKEKFFKTKHYHFERKDKEEDLKLLKEKEVEFWEKNVLKDKEPSLVTVGT
jgi:putative phage-type endonuclease